MGTLGDLQQSHLEAMRPYLEGLLQGFREGMKLEVVHGGYRIKTTSKYHIDVMRMLVNWRISVSTLDAPGWPIREWCYQGLSTQTFAAAALAALVWDGSDDTEPPGYFKRVAG